MEVMWMAQNKDSSRKHLCHSLEARFGEHCATSSPARKLLVSPNELLIDMLVLGNPVPAQLPAHKSIQQRFNTSEQSSLADKGWYHRAEHEWVMSHPMLGTESQFNKQAGSGHVPSSYRANKTKITPNCISHDRENDKLFQSRLSSCIQNKTTSHDFAVIFCKCINGNIKHNTFIYFQIPKELKEPLCV